MICLWSCLAATRKSPFATIKCTAISCFVKATRIFDGTEVCTSARRRDRRETAGSFMRNWTDRLARVDSREVLERQERQEAQERRERRERQVAQERQAPAEALARPE
jgi:hypothetical protein